MLEEIYIPGFGDISRELEAEFRRGFQLEAAMARKRQLEAAEARKRLGFRARPSELGELRCQVDPFWYHYWGQREDYAIWSDRREVDAFLRDSPEMRVEVERPARVHGWDGPEQGLVEGKPVSREERMVVR